MSQFTSGESERFERLMKEVPGFDILKVRPEDANGDCYRCDQFDREARKCRFSFCLFDDLPTKHN